MCERMTPPKIVPMALVSLGSSRTLMAGTWWEDMGGAPSSVAQGFNPAGLSVFPSFGLSVHSSKGSDSSGYRARMRSTSAA